MDDYRYEKTRIESFKDWPIQCGAILKIIDWTSSGLYYTGHADFVRCFECGVELHGWFDCWTRHPRFVHATMSPYCRFINGEKCGNVGLFAECFMGEKPSNRLVNFNNYGCHSMTELKELLVTSL